MLIVRPIELRSAAAFIAAHHRHHPNERAHRFSIACYDDDRLCGVAVCGRPKARAYDPNRVLEVTRLCTDGTANACSKLYGAAARAARAMGFDRIQSYIMDSESGASLRASGWTLEADGLGGGDWNAGHSAKLLFPTRRAADRATKSRWALVLREDAA